MDKNIIIIDRALRIKMLTALKCGTLDLDQFPEFTKGANRVNITIDSKDIILK